ncbi:globin domain-containing protein [Streptomyces sp. KE1]|uniref:globin domain-containing protein n=1 Tax=Streptomyces sp. KE1 TaxID=1638939 RepID=UPI00063E9CCD|nr:globin domain-containing protein [Streptomyces sp. KE1]KLJ00448.1 hemin transporter [Streptomyces sp. KE1]
MLTERSAATVRATLPAVGAAIGEITGQFYDRLFADRPELLRDLFNRGNQAAGTQRQALAGSIAAFAGHLLDHPDSRPDAMLARIAHKHASLGVTRDQYALVHQHLFAAIADVLGEAVTPQVAEAWDEVYWLMANALATMEERLTAEQNVLAAGTWRPWEVVARHDDTPQVAVLRLRPADGRPAAPFRAGQYVSVRVELPDGARQIRQYSLTGAFAGDERTIAVKRVPGGPGPEGEVSGHLHTHTRAGDLLDLSAPYGDLVLDHTPGADGRPAPVLLASAGIGCTPVVAMLGELAERAYEGRVTVVHGDRTPATHPLRALHTELAGRLADAEAHFWYEEPAAGPGALTGRVDLKAVAVAPGTRAYLCGPLPFMRAVREQLLEQGVRPADIHYEVFGPDLWLASADAAA